MGRILLVLGWLFAMAGAQAAQQLRIFTWDGYVTADDLAQVNKALRQRHLDVTAVVVTPFAEGPEQMFHVMRENSADVTFLTVNYLRMQESRIARLLQPIDPARLPNYPQLNEDLSRLPMGMDQGRPLYVPFGGGAYGIWANMARLKPEELPRSLKDLLQPRWRKRISLTRGQVQPNVALAYMAIGEKPFLIDEMVRDERRSVVGAELKQGQAKAFLDALYGQVREFWTDSPQFDEQDLLVASYGPEIAPRLARGQRWMLVPFKEGNTVWLDTMNIVKGVEGDKLEAAYVFINYMLSDAVQKRVVDGLSMVAVTRGVNNPQLKDNPDFFRASHFWPPYTTLSDNLMRSMSDNAMRANGFGTDSARP